MTATCSFSRSTARYVFIFGLQALGRWHEIPTVLLRSEVEVLVNRPIEATFDAFTTPESYLKVAGVTSVALLRPGLNGAPNTAGAIRRINLLLGKLVEEVPESDPPNIMKYTFLEWPVPFKHAGGSMRFFAQNDRTRVVWDSAFEVPDFFNWPFLPDVFKTFFGFSLESLARELKRVAESDDET